MTDNRVMINLKTGHTVKGRLASAFTFNDESVDILVEEENRRLTFSFDELCSIRFIHKPAAWTAGKETTRLEEVQTIAGETHKVAIFTSRKYSKGFVGMIEDETAEYRTVFFTSTGIRYRHEEWLIGEILKEQGALSDKFIDEALKAQSELKNRRMGEVLAESTDLSHEEIERALQEASRKVAAHPQARVGDILIEAGLVTREQVEKAFESQQNQKKMKGGELLVKQGLITEEQLLSALATKFRLPFVNLATVIPSEEAVGALSEGLVDRLQVFPVEFDGRRLLVATSSPTDLSIGDSLRFSTNYSIELAVATPRQIAAAIEKYYHHTKDAIDVLLESMKDEAQSVSIEEGGDNVQFEEPDSKVVSLINRVLLDAYRKGASDIHFEPGTGKNPLIIRYRIDGECLVAHKIATTYRNAVISRLKIIAGLDIYERRRPQSGKIQMRFEQRKLEYRVEVTPTVGGQEDAVLRLLAASRPLPLSEMGLMPYNLDRFTKILDKPNGLILCVGPTGSGKTTTLHSALGHINVPSRKIWTVEDPVEITQPGLRQVQVNSKIGFTFSEALRSFLRADPDVIMVGEMRDMETARIAIEASLTGHLVLSTLHTNSAPETIVRLIDMGLDPYNFSDALLGIVSQRLPRKLCDNCKKNIRPRRELYDELVETFVREAGIETDLIPGFRNSSVMERRGCEQCNGTGYRGRVAIHELMICTQAAKKGIRESACNDILRRTALEDGMWTLKMDGIIKVFQGLTDLDQIQKVCM
jgi:type II secretory ATPase GspE/PulE/Tfp pilus assembly ATPase PilB-like protein